MSMPNLPPPGQPQGKPPAPTVIVNTTNGETAKQGGIPIARFGLLFIAAFATGGMILWPIEPLLAAQLAAVAGSAIAAVAGISTSRRD